MSFKIKSLVLNNYKKKSPEQISLNEDEDSNLSKSFDFKVKCKTNNEYYYINIQLNEKSQNNSITFLITSSTYDREYKTNYYYKNFITESNFFNKCKNIKEIYNYLETLIKSENEVQIILNKLTEQMRLKIKLIECYENGITKNMFNLTLKETKENYVEKIEISNADISFDFNENKNNEIISIDSSSLEDEIDISIKQTNAEYKNESFKKINFNKIFNEDIESQNNNINNKYNNKKLKIPQFLNIKKIYQKDDNDIYDLFQRNTKINNNFSNSLYKIFSNNNSITKKKHLLYNEFYNSKILKSKKEIRFLLHKMKQLNKGIRQEIKKIKLLYRATENGFSSNIFKQKCEGENDILLIFKTETNIRFGAFIKKYNIENSKNDKRTFYDRNNFKFNLNKMRFLPFMEENKNSEKNFYFDYNFLDNAIIVGKEILNNIENIDKKNFRYDMSYDYELNDENEVINLEEIEAYKLYYGDTIYIFE